MHPLGAPERGPGRCDNTSVGIVHPWGVYFEARASSFVCLKDKTCLRAEGGQGDDGACCLVADAFVALYRAQGLDHGFPGCFVARRSRAVGLSRCCAAQRPGAQLRFISSGRVSAW